MEIGEPEDIGHTILKDNTSPVTVRFAECVLGGFSKSIHKELTISLSKAMIIAVEAEWRIIAVELGHSNTELVAKR